ncbi:fructose-1,6-bisphosphate aldolase, class II [Candidatus Vecturithrix granuli]|uniref:Fructose-1,6-bisphosphate aldolase, class II n=1 Tax=Vecturithrix granuli TaxID=1499967 RepID=A0A081BTZ1_VECG1|nr:fructose-1,6-bisphosphate aldolase, class II [Candidatus Vecturithrix granuli]
MGLVPITQLLADARKQKYAVGAFNIVNLETLQAVVTAAEAENSPVIVQVWHGDLSHAGLPYLSALARVAAESVSVPVALQLDHGQSYAQAMTCIDAGFSSVMIDLASSDFQENVRRTKEVVQAAHARNVSVEAELGQIFDGQSSIEQRNSGLTDPKLAAKFVRETGVDALAVSIGTAHGLYAAKPVVDFTRLETIINTIQAPVVIHGGSNTPDDDIRRMVQLGVAKVNIGTDLMIAFLQGLRDTLASDDPRLAVRDVLGQAREYTYKVTRQKIQLLNTYRYKVK